MEDSIYAVIFQFLHQRVPIEIQNDEVCNGLKTNNLNRKIQ